MVHELNNDFEVGFHQVMAFIDIVYLQLQYHDSKHVGKSSFADFGFLVHISKNVIYKMFIFSDILK